MTDDRRRCATCRHWVPVTNAYGGGCHGPGASIYSLKAKQWTTDRAVFAQAARAVGLYQYAWSGRATGPDDVCGEHETQEEAAVRGVPFDERIERRKA